MPGIDWVECVSRENKTQSNWFKKRFGSTSRTRSDDLRDKATFQLIVNSNDLLRVQLFSSLSTRILVGLLVAGGDGAVVSSSSSEFAVKNSTPFVSFVSFVSVGI